MGSCQNGEISWNTYADAVNKIKNKSFSLLFFNVINITIVILKNEEVSKIKTKNRLVSSWSRCLGQQKSVFSSQDVPYTLIKKRLLSLSVVKIRNTGCVCVCVCVHVCPLTQSCLILCNPMDGSQWGSSVLEIFQAWKIPTHGVCCHFLLQWNSPTQGSNLRLISPALVGEFFTTSDVWDWVSLCNLEIQRWICKMRGEKMKVSHLKNTNDGFFWPIHAK